MVNGDGRPPRRDRLGRFAAPRRKAARPGPPVTPLEVARRTRFHFRFNPKVVAWATAAHGTMTVDAAVREARRRFGRARAPSRSALARYWAWLDERLIDRGAA